MPAYTVGWVYNLHDPSAPTTAGRDIALAVAFSTIACLAVLLRFVIRGKPGRLGADDWAAFGSVVLGVAYSAITIYRESLGDGWKLVLIDGAETRWGLGLDPKDFPAANVVEFSKIQYSGGPTYCLALLGFKLSLLFAYNRLAGFNRTYRLIIYAVIALVTCNQVIFAFLLSVACNPIAKQWDPSITGHCIDQLASYFGLGGSSLAFDLIIISLPFPVLTRLQLNLQEKVVLCGLFALGFFVTVIQIIRIFTIANLATYTDSERIILWSIVEINLGVIVSCVPTFKPLFNSLYSRTSGYVRSHERVLEAARLSKGRRRQSPSSDGQTPDWGGVKMTTLVESRQHTHLDLDQESQEGILPDANKNEITAVTELIIESELRPQLHPWRP